MNTVRIFIASSPELKEDRDQFRLFISQENELPMRGPGIATHYINTHCYK